MTATRLVPYMLSALGLGTAAYALDLGLWAYGGPAAGLFPFMASLLLIGTSLASTREHVAEGGPIEVARLLAYCFALGSYCLLLEGVGFVPSTFMFLVGVFILVERMNWQRSVLLAALFALATWTLFETLLSVPLPHGEWRF
ncbi:tripartite tricarboxylate transporter TctB family protein [Ciceribacter azotifigens]|uniref:tripartite tricarboxylate transporter TctB family protein n=1 Tax=Ciceribacter azotifigens TaxID=2069303 RepID=UPI003A8AFE82